jgi:lipoprotein-anchoring transpeptidase ErfK/SrfK
MVVGWRGTSHTGGTAPLIASAPEPVTGRAAANHQSPPTTPTTSRFVAAAASKPVLSPSARRSCPPAASACADLSASLTWLQSDGKITYGPVRLKAGLPRTPRGTFHVEWKAGAHYMSNEFDEPMPYAVFFAPGGIAFHGGSLTKRSHGCIHLDINSARYYDDHLPVGAEVVVF